MTAIPSPRPGEAPPAYLPEPIGRASAAEIRGLSRTAEGHRLPRREEATP